MADVLVLLRKKGTDEYMVTAAAMDVLLGLYESTRLAGADVVSVVLFSLLTAAVVVAVATCELSEQ